MSFPSTLSLSHFLRFIHLLSVLLPLPPFTRSITLFHNLSPHLSALVCLYLSLSVSLCICLFLSLFLALLLYLPLTVFHSLTHSTETRMVIQTYFFIYIPFISFTLFITHSQRVRETYLFSCSFTSIFTHTLSLSLIIRQGQDEGEATRSLPCFHTLML